LSCVRPRSRDLGAGEADAARLVRSGVSRRSRPLQPGGAPDRVAVRVPYALVPAPVRGCGHRRARVPRSSVGRDAGDARRRRPIRRGRAAAFGPDRSGAGSLSCRAAARAGASFVLHRELGEFPGAMRAEHPDRGSLRRVTGTRPRVSVVMPARNAADTVARAVRSVLAQTFPDFELLVVDDGSTDETADAALAAAAGDARLRILDRGRCGLVAALNAGIDAARGRLIARLDADDEMLPRRLEAQVALLDERPDVG